MIVYDVDDNNDTSGIVTPTGLSWDSSCDASHLCAHVIVVSDVAKNFTFWIKVTGDGNKY